MVYGPGILGNEQNKSLWNQLMPLTKRLDSVGFAVARCVLLTSLFAFFHV